MQKHAGGLLHSDKVGVEVQVRLREELFGAVQEFEEVREAESREEADETEPRPEHASKIPA